MVHPDTKQINSLQKTKPCGDFAKTKLVTIPSKEHKRLFIVRSKKLLSDSLAISTPHNVLHFYSGPSKLYNGNHLLEVF
jgi:hypothetical protein